MTKTIFRLFIDGLFLSLIMVYITAFFAIAYSVLIATVFLFTIVVHEWGHYIPAYHFDVRPKFIFSFWGIGVTGFWSHLKMTESLFTSMTGIFFGLIPLLVFDVPYPLITIYYIMCVGDFLQIYGDVLVLWKYGNRKKADLLFLA